MFRIDTLTKVLDLFGIGKHGFRDGNRALAVPATDFSADWCNSIQEEICNVIEAAGIALDVNDRSQLLQAIQQMVISGQKAVVISNATFEASVADGEAVRWDAGNNRFDEAVADGTANNRAVGIADVTNAKVYIYGECPLFAGLTPGARYYLDAATPGAITTVAPADGVTVGIAKSATVLWVDIDSGAAVSDASETVKGIVELATDAEAQAFTANKVLDGAKLAAALKGANQALSGNGYQKLPGGMILQWGSFTSNATAGSPVSVTFPIAFPTACLNIVLNVDYATNATQSAWYNGKSATGFSGRSTITNNPVNYIAVGH